LEPLKLSIQWRKTLIRWASNGGSTIIRCENRKYLMRNITYLCTWASCRWCTNEDGHSVTLVHLKTLHPPSLKTASPCAAGKNFLDPCTVSYPYLVLLLPACCMYSLPPPPVI
jgi:hypothetical protein